MKPLRVSNAARIVPSLQNAIRRSEDCRYSHRLHGVLLVAQGMSCLKVGHLFGDGAQTVRNWVRQFEEKGLIGLINRERSGRPPRLNDKHIKKIASALRQTPNSFGIAKNLWDGKTLSAFIKERFGVKLGIRRCQRMFKELGFRMRRPRPQTIRINSRKNSLKLFSTPLRKGVLPTWRAILDETYNRQAHLVFIDEAGFMMNPIVRKTWAPIGCTPTIQIQGNPHDRISAIGAMMISPKHSRFGFHFCLLEDNLNFRAGSIIRFIEDIRRKLHAPFTVLGDQIPIHQGKPLELYLASHRGIIIESFPPYAPELNPVDRVWGYVKYGRLANYCPHDLHELRKRVTTEFRRIQKRPALLKSLFNSTGLTLSHASTQTTTDLKPQEKRSIDRVVRRYIWKQKSDERQRRMVPIIYKPRNNQTKNRRWNKHDGTNRCWEKFKSEQFKDQN